MIDSFNRRAQTHTHVHNPFISPNVGARAKSMQFPPLPFGLDKYLALKIAKTRYCVELDNNNEKAQTMTSVGTKGTTTASSSAADLVGCNGEGLFGK